MAKLTHIEDVERREAEEEDKREMLEAQEALQRAQAQEAERQTAARHAETEDAAQVAQVEETLETLEEAAEGDPVLDVTADAERDAIDRNADEEMEFHGLSSDDSMGAMQKVLIVLAVIIFVAAILYVVNSWVHFV